MHGEGGRHRRGEERPGRGPWGGPRMRRGDMRLVLLQGLAEGPAHGYELIRRLEERSNGMWRPSPGSVYPTLQLLEDEGMARSDQTGGKRVYDLTAAGRQEAEAGHVAQPWADGHPGEGSRRSLRDAVGQLHDAARQVGAVGRPEQVDQAVALVNQARQALYRLLAEE